MKMLWMFLTLLLLVGCQENRRSEKKEVEVPLVVVERTDAPVHDAQTVAKLFHLGYTKAELAAFGPPPTPRPGYVTFFDPGWKIRKFRSFYDHAAFLELELPKQYPNITMLWGGGGVREFEEKPQFRRLRMGPAKDSFLLPEEEVPPLRQVVAAVAIHTALAGETLFDRCTFRCSDAVVMVDQRSGREQPTIWSDRLDEENHYHCGLPSARCLP